MSGSPAGGALPRKGTDVLGDASVAPPGAVDGGLAEARLREFVQATGDFLWETDERGAYTFVTPNVASVLGYAAGEVLGRAPFEFMPPEDAEKTRARFGRIVAEGRPFTLLSHRSIRKDGRVIWLECSGSPIRDGARVVGWRGVDRDITERKRVAERWAKINAAFLRFGPDPVANIGGLALLCRDLFEADCCVYHRFENGRVFTVDACHGGPEATWSEAAEGRVYLDVARRAEPGPVVLRDLQSTPYAKSDPNIEAFGLRTCVGHPVRSGTRTVAALSAVFRRDVELSEEDLRILGTLAAAVGVEELRLEAGRELEKSEQRARLRASVEAAIASASRLFVSSEETDLDAVLGLLGEAVGVHRSYVFRFRDGLEKMDNTHEWCARGVTPERDNLQGLESSMFPWWMKRLLKGDNIAIADVSALPPEADAEREILEAQRIRSLLVTPIRSSSGRLLGFMGFDDVASTRDWPKEDVRALRVVAEMVSVHWEREEARERLRLSEEQLRQSQKMEVVGKLISSVAHELNNPLAAVVGYAQLLKARAGSKKVRDALGQIHRNAARCRRIMDNLLVFVRHAEPRRASVSPRRVLRQTLDLFKYRLGTSHPVDVRLEVAEGLRVHADPQQLEQVAVNLIANACEAMTGREGPRTLLISGARRGRRVQLAFEDSGPGVPPASRERVFEPFYTSKPAGEGTGLGLAICRQIALEHGGSLTCGASSLGGASFLLELPGAAKPRSRRAPARRSARPRRGLRVLVVDDEPSVARMVGEAIARLGGKATVAGGVNEARRLLGARSFDLVLADAALGDGTGVELWDGLEAPRAPFLLMTGNVLDPALAAALKRRGLACLSKPFDLDELRSAIASSAGRQAGVSVRPRRLRAD